MRDVTVTNRYMDVPADTRESRNSCCCFSERSEPSAAENVVSIVV